MNSASSSSTPQPTVVQYKSTHSSADSSGQLPLEYEWDVYHIDPHESMRQIGEGIWQPLFIASFSTVRDFWCLFNNIAPPSFLPFNTHLFVFKHGIQPTWENIDNKNGGELSFLVNTQEEALDEFDDVWRNTLMALIGEYFSESKLINGISCASKAKYAKFSFWIRDAKDEAAILKIKQEWVELCNTRLNSQFKNESLAFKPFSK
jgi:hypothetical protein